MGSGVTADTSPTAQGSSAIGQGDSALQVSGEIPERPRVADHVYARLRDAIVTNQLTPGSKLSVPSIAGQLRVSRSPVREAVQRLVLDGLATEEPHRGAVVARIRVEELVPLYEVREVLEGLAVRLAAQRATREELAGMQVTLQQHAEAVEREDLQQHITLDMQFHALLLDAARNPDLTDFLQRVQRKMVIAMVSGDSSTWPKKAIAEHRQILEAVLAGDPAQAEAAARAHVTRVRDNLAAMAEEQRSSPS